LFPEEVRFMVIEEERLAEDEKTRKAKELDNSELFDMHVWSEHREVNKAVDALYNEIKRLPEFEGRNERLRKKHVKVVVLDLYVKWVADPKRYSSYHRQRTRYSELDERYNKLHISYLTVPIVDALERLGYIEHFKGHYSRTGGRSHISRMRATLKLINLILKKHKITSAMIERAPNTECIILRDYGPDKDKQVDISYQDTEETRRMRIQLCAYNNLIRRTPIDIPHFPAEGVLSRSGTKRIRIDFADPSGKFVRRIFNNGSWSDGGRFYGGWWQRLPKQWRKRIKIYDMPTQEIDYSGLHIAILYALAGRDYWATVGRVNDCPHGAIR
jgi:hypothetical protein